MKEKIKKNDLKKIIIVFIGFIIFILGFMAYIGSHARYMADDYWYFLWAKDRSIIEATFYWYVNWNCRLFANFLDCTAAKIGPPFLKYSPFIYLSFWLSSLFFLLTQIKLKMKLKGDRLISIFISFLVVYATLSLAPTIHQSFYWSQNMRAVISPLITFNILFGLLFYFYRKSHTARQIKIGYVLIFLVAFIGGGFHEVFTCIQIFFLFCLIIVFKEMVQKKKKARNILLSALFGSISSLIMLLSSPGLAIRKKEYPTDLGLAAVIFNAVGDCFSFANGLIFSPQGMIVFWLIVFGIICSYFFEINSERMGIQNRKLDLIVGFLVIMLISIFIPFFLAQYGTNRPLPIRTQIIPVYPIVLGSLGIGILLGEWLKKKKKDLLIGKKSNWVILAIAAIFLIEPLYQVPVLRKQLQEYRSFGQYWDKIDHHIINEKKNGAFIVEVPYVLNPADLTDPRPHPEVNWVNQHIDNYYGLKVRFIEK